MSAPASVHTDQGRAILLVDDEEAILLPLTALFEEEGFAVDTAQTCAAARDRVSVGPPYASVVLDRKLGDGNGLDLVPLIRAAQPTASIIVWSGDLRSASETSCVDAVMSKAESFACLLSAVNDLSRARPALSLVSLAAPDIAARPCMRPDCEGPASEPPPLVAQIQTVLRPLSAEDDPSMADLPVALGTVTTRPPKSAPAESLADSHGKPCEVGEPPSSGDRVLGSRPSRPRRTRSQGRLRAQRSGLRVGNFEKKPSDPPPSTPRQLPSVRPTTPVPAMPTESAAQVESPRPRDAREGGPRGTAPMGLPVPRTRQPSKGPRGTDVIGMLRANLPAAARRPVAGTVPSRAPELGAAPRPHPLRGAGPLAGAIATFAGIGLALALGAGALSLQRWSSTSSIRSTEPVTSEPSAAPTPLPGSPSSAPSAEKPSALDARAVANLERLRAGVKKCANSLKQLPGTSPHIPRASTSLAGGAFRPAPADFRAPFFACTEFLSIDGPMDYMIQWQFLAGRRGLGVAWVDADGNGTAERAYAFDARMRGSEVEVDPIGPIDPARVVPIQAP